MSGNGSGFEEARRREPDLNERQREVLDLLVAGKTNAEIGEALGITLDGAKWNVSEILTKLGFDSREEAADYWRWRNRGMRRVGPAVRRMVAGTVFKVAAGVGGGVAAGAVGLALLLGGGGDEPVVASAGSFYLEASVVVRSDPSAQDVGRSIAGSATPTGQATENRFTLRWWYQDVDHARWELESLTPSLDQQTTVVVYDGKEQWIYGSARNRYTQDPIPPMPPEVKYRPIGLSAAVGPTGASSVDDFMARYRTAGNASEWERTGESTLLGRHVEIVELQFPSMAIATAVAPGSTAAGTATTVLTPEPGINRFWIDPVTVFVLRNEFTGNPGWLAEVTKLEMGAAIPAEKLRFRPPAGSVRTTSGATSGGSSGTSVSIPATGAPSIPPGLLPITYIPSGYRTGGVQRASDNQGIVSYGIEFVGSGGDHVSIDQRGRADGVPETLKTSDVVSLPGGVQGYRRTEGDLRTLAFAKDGIAVAISATGLPFDELERMAAGMLAP